jgi:hypothetical protein
MERGPESTPSHDDASRRRVDHPEQHEHVWPQIKSTVQRWGDYSYTSLDPMEDMTMWAVQGFSNATNSWAVRVVKLIAPPPVTLASASPASIAA